MFAKKTVFVLGAGASWHYGYPTGEELVQKVMRKAIYVADLFKENNRFASMPLYVEEKKRSDSSRARDVVFAWESAELECRELARRIKEINPPVIDSFLGHNPTLQPIGKLMIALVILECEGQFEETGRNINRRSGDEGSDNWLRFVIHELLNGCQSVDGFVQQNHVYFVTFNYDVSLERFLYSRLCQVDLLNAHKESVQAYLQDRIVHIYGKVWENPYIELEESSLRPNGNGGLIRYIDRGYRASGKIRTIDPHDKNQDESDLAKARNVISDAQVVYFLGYGFDKNNGKRLALQDLREKEQDKRILFTNFQNRDSVNKRAASSFSFRPHDFSSHESPVKEFRGQSSKFRFIFEKSISNVYDALDKDFDL